MRAVVKERAVPSDCPFYHIEGQSLPKYIGLRDEDDIRLRQIIIIRTFGQCICIHDTAVVACSARCCSFSCTLNLDVELLSIRKCMDVEPHVVSMQVLHGVLRHDVRCMEIRTIQDDLQDQIDTGKTVLEHCRHKDVIE